MKRLANNLEIWTIVGTLEYCNACYGGNLFEELWGSFDDLPHRWGSFEDLSLHWGSFDDLPQRWGSFEEYWRNFFEVL